MNNSKVRLFDAFEVGNKLSAKEYEALVPDLRVDLINAQYDLQNADFAVLVVLAGDSSKDVNEVLNVLHEWMDARYLRTRVFLPPDGSEKTRPPFWRYWRELPPRGRIGVHVGAWPLRAIAERFDEGSEATFERRLRRMNALEKTLVDDGTNLIKLWLHLPNKERKKRLKRAKRDPDSEPFVRQRDWQVYEQYDEIEPIVEQLIHKTSRGTPDWTVVESANARFRNVAVARAILDSVRGRLDAPQLAVPDVVNPEEGRASTAGALTSVDLTASLSREDYRERLEDLQGELSRLARKARNKVGTVLAFEGWDAAGKGGVIRRVTSAMFAQDYRVIPVGAPTDEERARHYLWRFWRHIPSLGEMVIFDRTWYGRVLVERVEGFARREEWSRAYAEIRDFEEELTDHGLILCKFWLHIDPDEQLRRFQERERTRYKKYKITDEDYRNREKWSAYETAVNEMVTATSTKCAPWYIVAANDKKWARVQVLETVVKALRARL